MIHRFPSLCCPLFSTVSVMAVELYYLPFAAGWLFDDYDCWNAPLENKVGVFVQRDVPNMLRRVEQEAAKQRAEALELWEAIQEIFSYISCSKPMVD